MLSIAIGAVTEASGGPFLVLRRASTLLASPPEVRLSVSGSTQKALSLVELPDPSYPELRAALRRRGVQVYRGVLSAADLAGRSGVHARLRVLAAGEESTADVRPIPSGRGPLSFAFASCFYGHSRSSASFGGSLERALRSSQSRGHPIDFTLLAGDNLYVDIAPDQERFPVETGAYDEIAERYLSYFLAEQRLAPALRAGPTLFTYDDHELWNDYPFPSAWLSRSSGPHAASWVRASCAGIDTFQHSLNPRTPGLNRSYELEMGGFDFFVADTRTERSADRLMSDARWAALSAWLVRGERPKVLVLGQPLWQEGESKTLFVTGDHNLAYYARQYAELCAALARCRWDVLVLAGDVHFSRLLQLRLGPSGALRVHELVCSPAEHIPSTGATIGHYLSGSGLRSQGRTEVELGDGPGLRIDPRHRLERELYRMGTGCPNTYALVSLERIGDSRVDVWARFVDHRGSAVTSPRLEPGASRYAGPAEFAPANFSLRRR
jgi:hypothetical protein